MTREELRALWDTWQLARKRYEAILASSPVFPEADALFEKQLESRLCFRAMRCAEEAFEKAVSELP